MDIKKTTVYTTADNALNTIVALENEAKFTYEVMSRATDRDLQFALAFHCLEIRKELGEAERHYAEATMNLIVACRAVDQEIVVPTV
jgi:hypothetical protein